MVESSKKFDVGAGIRAQDRKILLAFGKTGTGKSTLLNMCAGIDTIGDEDNESCLFKASSDTKSCTTNPKFENAGFLGDPKKKVTLVDMPGLSDTRSDSAKLEAIGSMHVSQMDG